MYEDALRRRLAHESRLGMFLSPGERHEWSVTAMCLELGAGTDNEGYLVMTDRRVAFYPDAADPLMPPSPVLDYDDIARLRSERGPMKSAMVAVTTESGEAWHFVTGRKSVKMLKKLVRRST
jgi:hypothetical protein